MMICSPNVTPFPLGHKKPKKSTREKGAQYKDAIIRNKFTQTVNLTPTIRYAHKQYHILVLVWNQGKRTNTSKSGIKRKE